MATTAPKQPFFGGEVFDLTMTSVSDFGIAKIKEAYTNKLAFSMQYYIEELKKMVTGKEDDKTEKRKQRLNFLEGLAGNKVYTDLFEKMTTYLNGGSESYQAGTEQNFIFVVAGGNIINIFFQLVTRGLKLDNELGINDEDRETLKTNASNKFTDFNADFQAAIKKLSDEEARHGNINFSDIDYNYVPLCDEKQVEELEKSNKNASLDQGFLLFRIKSRFKGDIQSIPNLQKENCIELSKFKDPITNQRILKEEITHDKLYLQTVSKNLQTQVDSLNVTNEFSEDKLRRVWDGGGWRVFFFFE